MPIKITGTSISNRTIKSFDVEIEGAGILYEEENCHIFSENVLLLSTASGNTNFTLTPGQVVVPELPELLTPEEAQVIVDHHNQIDGALRALDAIVTRVLTAR
jgi:hypothetical protein